MKNNNAPTSLDDEATTGSSQLKSGKTRVLDGNNRELRDLLRDGYVRLTLSSGRKVIANLVNKTDGACFVFKCSDDRLFEARFRPALGPSRRGHPWACRAYKPFLALSPAEQDELKTSIRVLACAYMDHSDAVIICRN